MKLLPVTAKSLPAIWAHLEGAPNICDFSAGTIYMWKDFYKFSYGEKEGNLFIHSERENSYFPCWQCEAERHVEYLKNITGEQKLIISPVPEVLLDGYAKLGKAVELCGWADYLYDAQEFIELKGKKYHGKRNHIKNFVSTYDYTFEPLNGDEREVIDFVSKLGQTAESCLAKYEVAATISALLCYDKLKLLSGVLRVEGKVAGITLGEICGDTLIVHTERCDRNYDGIYEAVAHFFADKYAKNVKYINREEDLGDEGLRRAKESWRPITLLKKYRVEID